LNSMFSWLSNKPLRNASAHPKRNVRKTPALS
jgi:hypothetical protein